MSIELLNEVSLNIAWSLILIIHGNFNPFIIFILFYIIKYTNKNIFFSIYILYLYKIYSQYCKFIINSNNLNSLNSLKNII